MSLSPSDVLHSGLVDSDYRSKIISIVMEGTNQPQTRLGVGCMGIFTRFSATIMALGPLAGMYLSRYGYGDIAIVLVGTLLCPSAIAMAQIFSHQLWNKRPWAQQEETEREEL